MLGARPNFRQKVLEVPCFHSLAEASASSKSIAAITKQKTGRDKREIESTSVVFKLGELPRRHEQARPLG